MGGTSAKVGSSARFELISSFALASQSSFVSINRNERPISDLMMYRQFKIVFGQSPTLSVAIRLNVVCSQPFQLITYFREWLWLEFLCMHQIDSFKPIKVLGFQVLNVSLYGLRITKKADLQLTTVV